MMLVSQLMTILWRKHIRKEAYFIFTIPLRQKLRVLSEHGPLIVALFLAVISHINWSGPWTISGGEWSYITVTELYRDYKRDWK